MVDLDTRLLRAFVAVAEELNFTRAAGRLHLAQQALSAQVRQLETRLGVALFERTTRRVELTEAGEALLAPARAVLGALEEGTTAARRAARGDGGLTVALFPMSSTEITSAILRRFGERHPETELSVGNLAMPDAVAALHGGRADVAFVRPPLGAEGLSLVTISTEPRVAALPADHPLAAEDVVDPGALAREPQVFVEGADPVQADFWTLAEHRGDEPVRIGARMTGYDEFFGVVSAGLAVGVCPASATAVIGPAFPGVRFRPLAGVAPCTVAVAWPTARETPMVRAFVQTALEVAAAD